jgi:hypothetical protein
VAEQARDNFQAESHNKDNRITVLEETRQTWMTKTQELDAKREALLAENSQLDHQVNKLSDALRVRLDECNELKAERNRLLKEGAHTCTEECVVLETIDPGSVLDQALAAAERAEKAAEGVLKALRAAEPGSYRVSSEGRVWVLVGQLDDSAEPEGWAAVAEPDRPLLAGTELTEPEHIEPVTVPERTCKRCGETKPLEGGWRRDATKPGGYRFPCASCSRAMDQARDTAHRERIREAAESATAHLPIPAGMVVPEGMKRCGTCEHVKPLVEFAKDSSKADGLRYQCRKCRNALVVRTTPNSQLTLTEKTCNECAETKPVDAFSKDAKSSGGVKGKCKDCCARRDAQRKRDRSKK